MSEGMHKVQHSQGKVEYWGYPWTVAMVAKLEKDFRGQFEKITYSAADDHWVIVLKQKQRVGLL